MAYGTVDPIVEWTASEIRALIMLAAATDPAAVTGENADEVVAAIAKAKYVMRLADRHGLVNIRLRGGT